MTLRRQWLFAILLVLTACRDTAAPFDELNVLGDVVSQPTAPAGVHMLRQAAAAPPLETYKVSFWAYKGKASTVTVNYQPAVGEWVSEPFLRFDIPKNGLVAGANGVRLRKGDSVWVTLAIDSLDFAVVFKPSGVLFSTKFPANLTIWYENADPDLNGDGVVNGKDAQLERQLAIWYHAAKTRWSQLSSDNDIMQLSVSTALYHFSEYAVSW